MIINETITPWQNVPKNLDEFEGFVYQITNKVTQEKYIGRKYLASIRRKKVKDRKRKIVEKKESDWQYYRSSSKRVHDAIIHFGIENFEFKIINCFKTRGETNFAETELLFKNEVLNKRIKIDNELEIFEWYNDNILNRYFRKKKDYSPGYILKYNRYIIEELKKLGKSI